LSTLRSTRPCSTPACGTAGFLISAYKHILKANSSPAGVLKSNGEPDEKAALDSSRIPPARGDLLTPDERARLAANFKGYDISPDMVRLSLVNLYLHGFTDPHIYEYDTLTSQERWNEYADVILANPPFMSPKGGIRPHNRFSVKSKRSEVLFVDYIAEHLTPGGRAGIIVPEGIIFQGQNAYKQLRKLLVEESLVAVVSLPAGVFQPYSGVKTSILILDKSLAKQSATIGFFKIENDGFSLGAQRREIRKNDLPQCRAELAEFLHRLRAREAVEGFEPTTGLVVPKGKIAANGDYNLSGERYRESAVNAGLIWPLVSIGELCVVKRGASPRPIQDFITDAPDGVNWIKIGDAELGSKYITATKQRITPEGAAKSRRVKPGDLLLSNSMSYGRPYVMATDGCIHDGWLLLRDHSDRLDQDFFYHMLGSQLVFEQFRRAATGGVVNNLNSEIVRGVKIPLPPLEVQKEIVAEIEGYQKVIDGARTVLDNYRPHIAVHPDWPMVELGDQTVFKIESGGTPKSDVDEYWGGPVAWVTLVDLPASDCVSEISHTTRSITERGLAESSAKILPVNSVLVSTRATIGRIGINRIPLATNQGFKNVVIEDTSQAVPKYVAFALTDVVPIMEAWAAGGTFKELSKSKFCELKIPLPPLTTQQAIVAEIEAEKSLVAANGELITRFEKKIQLALARVWGEDERALVEV
jgi:type I restriction enzyme M protein